jgi:hypothetical protein
MRLDQDLEYHGLTGFEPISELTNEIGRLRKKIDSVLRGEQEIERWRQYFVLKRAESEMCLNTIESKIESFAYSTLSVVRENKAWLLKQRPVLEDCSKPMDDSWSELCKLRVLPEQASVDVIHDWKARLIVRCDTTLPVLDDSIRRLEDAKVSCFVSSVASCRSAQCEAADQYQQLPSDPSRRADGLSNIISQLGNHSRHLMEFYEDLRRHDLVPRVSGSDHDFMTAFHHCCDPYDQEKQKLFEYFNNLSAFERASQAAQCCISDIPLRHNQMHPSMRRATRLYAFDRLAQETRAAIFRLDSLLVAIGQSSEQCGIPVSNNLRERRDALSVAGEQGLQKATEYMEAREPEETPADLRIPEITEESEMR